MTSGWTDGAKLRPPIQPPYATGMKGHPALTGIAIFRDAMWVLSAAGVLMKLPRKVSRASDLPRIARRHFF